jgi:hypothetical protein
LSLVKNLFPRLAFDSILSFVSIFKFDSSSILLNLHFSCYVLIIMDYA